LFTGIIQTTSELVDVGSRVDGGFKIRLGRPKNFQDLKIGESIAVNGVCLTLTEFTPLTIDFFVGNETLEKTTFANLQTGLKLNLERSLSLGDRLGGHMVSGHVDGVGEVLSATNDGECLAVKLRLKPEQFKFVVPKGSIAVDGVSLTVNNVDRESKTIDLYLIPETLAQTSLDILKAGQAVNIENDQLVKIIAYQVENMKGTLNA
jgi:riboflavin synthase